MKKKSHNDYLVEQRIEKLRRVEDSSFVFFGFAALSLILSVSRSWGDAGSNAENGFLFALSIGFAVYGIVMKDKYRAAQRELKLLGYKDEIH